MKTLLSSNSVSSTYPLTKAEPSRLSEGRTFQNLLYSISWGSTSYESNHIRLASEVCHAGLVRNYALPSSERVAPVGYEAKGHLAAGSQTCPSGGPAHVRKLRTLKPDVPKNPDVGSRASKARGKQNAQRFAPVTCFLENTEVFLADGFFTVLLFFGSYAL